MRTGYNQTRWATSLALVAIVAALLGAAFAEAAPFAAHATRPSYDEAALELVGTGSYRTAKAKTALRVTVCLRKRVGGRFFQVRCAIGEGSGTRVEARVSVPGCVRGSWSTTATGEAENRQGAWVHQSSTVSRPFRCG